MNKTKITRALLTARNLLTGDDDRIDLDCTRLALGNIEDALQELAKSEWHSITESLPPFGVDVLVCNENDPDDIWWSHRSDNPTVVTDSYGFCNYLLSGVTHWRKVEKLKV